MKQKDIALIIVIAAISGGVSFALSQYIFAAPQNSQQSVAVVDKISTDFRTPDATFFNSNAINPAKSIEIGGSTNSNPFSHTGH